MVDEQDNRKHPRSELGLKVEYPDADAFLHDYTENISQGGTFIYSERSWSVGDRIRLRLSFPGLLRPIRLRGRVAWVRTEGERGIGVEFLFHEDPEAQRQLARLVEAIGKGDTTQLARQVRVLIVEDNQVIQRLLTEGIGGLARRELGDAVTFAFRNAANGVEALDLVGKESFDIIITDLLLPVMDGVEMIRRCRKVLGDEIPIVVVTAADEETARSAVAAGANLCLSKPIRLLSIFKTVERLMGLSQEQD